MRKKEFRIKIENPIWDDLSIIAYQILFLNHDMISGMLWSLFIGKNTEILNYTVSLYLPIRVSYGMSLMGSLEEVTILLCPVLITNIWMLCVVCILLSWQQVCVSDRSWQQQTHDSAPLHCGEFGCHATVPGDGSHFEVFREEFNFS